MLGRLEPRAQESRDYHQADGVPGPVEFRLPPTSAAPLHRASNQAFPKSSIRV